MMDAQVCVASVYTQHESWGSRTSSGVPLRDAVPSMAHRTYRLLGKMRVTNLDNGKTIVLRVIDRGPFRKHRCADLSLAAAKAIGLPGLGRVKVEPEE